ncbi:MAG: molybdate ABC transporter substrate-binding protein [Desulfotalea sp.]
MKNITKIFILSVLMISWNVSARAETINISVASSMTDTFKDIIAAYSVSHPETRVLANYGSSGSLAKQINQGAPADLYVSANPKWIKFLVDNKDVISSDKRVVAYNKLVFIGRGGATVDKMSDLLSLEKISIGTPQNVPAGQYARQAMKKTRVYSQLKEQRKLVMAKDVRQALLYADRGEVDGAFVYKTDALLAKDAKILFIVPDALYDRVVYIFALTTSGAERPVATAFYEFLATKKLEGILKKYGFEPAT